MLKEEQKRVRIPLLALLWGVMLLWAAGPCFATTTVIDTLLCQGAVFQHNGHHYSEPGVYYDTLVAADGQVHIDTLRLHAPVVTGATFLCFDAEDSLFAPLVADYYHWNTGDTTRGIRISEPGYYSVRLADGEGCFAATRVTQSYDPIRSIHLPAMCAGFPQPITIGYGDGYNVSLGRTDAHISRADTIFLPDGIDCGNGCSYISSVTFSGFPEYDTITSVNDILYVKLSIEHEWIGDLWIQLTCPNGQHTSILKKYPNSNGQTSSCSDSIPASEWHSYANYNYKFGVPNFINHDPICDASVNTIGVCRDYCWSEADNQGYVYSPGSYVYATSNRTTEINNSLNNGHGWQQTLFCKPTNMANMSNVFRPDGSFSDLIGCPVNGEWKIEVMDGWSQHNGYLCGWELALADGMIYDGTVVNASSTSTGMLQIDSTTFVVMPPDTIHSDTTITYPLTLIDDNGCQYDTLFHILIHPLAQSSQSSEICQGDTLRYLGASLTTAGNYPFYFPGSNGCDSVAYLRLMVNPSPRTEIWDTVCDITVWNGVTYNSSGNYTQFFQTAHGCDSIVTLHLIVNHSTHTEWQDTVCDSLRWNDSLYITSGTYTQHFQTTHGCDSTVTLNLTVNHSAHTEWSQTVCDSLRWNDLLYTTSGDHTQHLFTTHGCDSTVVLHLTVNRSVATGWHDTVCDSLRWNDSLYTSSGLYTQHLQTIHGCDSTVTLLLTVNPSAHTEWSQTVCDSLRWNDVLYTTSGDHIQRLRTAHDCDSIVTLHLTVNRSAHTEWSRTVCDSLRWNDSLYTTSGDHIQHFQTSLGCDSTVTLHLTVHQSVVQERSATVCDSLRWKDSLYTVSGIYTQHFHTVNGCDSTVTLHLTVNHSASSEWSQTVCDSLRWNGVLYTTSGNHIQHLQTATNCDSMVTLHLTVHHSAHTEWSQTVCDSLRWNDVLYTTSGDHTQHFHTAHGCDSAVTLHLTVHQSVVQERSATVCDSLRWKDSLYTVSGIYTQHFHTVNGCDSTVTIDLTVHHSASTALTSTVCDSLRWNDSLYTVSGIYTQHLQTAHGCDSTVTLALTVLTSPRSTLYDTIVENALPYDTLGLHFTASGVQSAAIPSASGCDSLVTVVLEVLPNTYLSYDTAVCASALPLAWRGHLFTAAGEWRDTLANPNGTSCYVSATLTQYPQPVLSISGRTHPGCYGTTTGSLTATVTGGTPPYSFQWQEANQTTPLNTATSTASDLPAGAYWAQVTDAHQCSAADSASLHYLYGEMTPGQISANQEVCEGNLAAPLTGSAASGGSNSSYQWQVSYNGTTFSPAPGTNNTQNFTPDTVTQWRMYRRAWISALCGTQYSNAVTVQSLPTPRDTIHASVCQDHAFDSLAFHVNAFDTHLPGTIVRINRAQTIYQCDSIVTLLLSVLPSAHDTLHDEVCQNNPYEANGFQIPSDSTSAPGTRIYQRQLVQTDCGCDSIVTLILTVNPTYRIEIQDHICEGDGYSQHGFRLSAGETIGTDHLQRRQELHTQLGCDSIIVLDLYITDTALTIDTYPYDFCEEYELTLTASSPLGNYLWNNGESSASVEVHSPGYYSVTASDGDCSATAGISIQPCNMTLFLPNAISPSNHDGLNDDFHLEAGYQRQITDFSIRIFDRWGNLVFASTDKNFRWQGEQNGTIIPNTTYNYVIKYRDLYGEEFTAKGTIIVL